jgi:hypothetical protein
MSKVPLPRLTITEAIDIFEHAYDQEDLDTDIRTIQFKVHEIREICTFLHFVRTSGIYDKYMSERSGKIK